MAYTLQAIITTAPVRSMIVKRSLPYVVLNCEGLCLVPFPHDYVKEHGIPCLPLTDDGTTIGSELDDVCRSLSKFGRVAYVEAEFFGVGTQACVLYEDSQPVSEPLVDVSASNHALRWLGIRKNHPIDEFEAVGLDRHRHTDDWLKGE